jgi:hypothetical protein
MPNSQVQTFVSTQQDAGLNSIYPQNFQTIPLVANANVYVTSNPTYVTQQVIINTATAGGANGEVQVNIDNRISVSYTHLRAHETG